MKYHLCYITPMARGGSGRVVIEVDPSLKHELYSALATSGSTLKDWFVRQATSYCAALNQPSLFEKSESVTASAAPDRQPLSKKASIDGVEAR
jgi:hypothetical protein